MIGPEKSEFLFLLIVLKLIFLLIFSQAPSVPRRHLKNFQAHRAAPTSYVEAPPMLEIKDHEMPLPTIREKSSRMQLKSGQVINKFIS